MIKFCPRCRTERPPGDFFCGGEIEGAPCHWDLSAEPFRPEGWRPEAIVTEEENSAAITDEHCPNGHAITPGDLMCLTCGAALAGFLEPRQAESGNRHDQATMINGWRLSERLTTQDPVCELFLAINEKNHQEGILHLYRPGFEPDPQVYETLKRLDLEHIPSFYDVGRWDSRAYEVLEKLTETTLADLGTVIDSPEGLKRIVYELGQALQALSEAGLRHRALRPGILLARKIDPLDLVISGFGSARISDLDLDIVSPLEISLYTAPEAAAGAVSTASDWWSLGIIILEQLTRGKFFEGVNPKAFFIEALSRGIKIPEELPPEARALLSGLTMRDHRRRWQWPEVKAWLEGRYTAPADDYKSNAATEGTAINLAGQDFYSFENFALKAAEEASWNEALQLFEKGVLSTWLAKTRASDFLRDNLNLLAGAEHLDLSWRLMLVLKLLNPEMPLVLRGEIVTPGWLLNNPTEGLQIIKSELPQLINAINPRGKDNWLESLQARKSKVSQIANEAGVTLNEEALGLYALNTSSARLTAIWAERRQLFPEARNQRLNFLMECSTLLDADLIMLLSAELSQFRLMEEIISETENLCKNLKTSFNIEEAKNLALQPKDALYRLLNSRLENFAFCGLSEADGWARDFRLTKRLPLPHTLALLLLPEIFWQTPPRHQFATGLMDFFEQKITLTASRSPLMRMSTGPRSTNIDLALLGEERLSAETLLNHITNRRSRLLALDPAIFDRDPALISRLSRLALKNDLYRRDTGIEGLYLGFPFLLVPPPVKTQKPRLLPLLLWPATLNPSGHNRRQAELGFDSGRDDVRLNPCLNVLMGPDFREKCTNLADTILGRSSISHREIMEILTELTSEADFQFAPLDPAERDLKCEKMCLINSAVLFHSSFLGQAVSEELRQLKELPLSGGALATLLDFSENAFEEEAEEEKIKIFDESFQVSPGDPSQDEAVRKALSGRGLLIEGPPGTGKSQTIVNMAAETVGRSQTMLIVCQKHAALEVVHKRLVAEGLASRVMMVNDANRDRLEVISQIRTQLEQLNEKNLFEKQQNDQLRLEYAEMVAHLEQELDETHQAHIKADSFLGISYQNILGQLLDLPPAPIEAPQLKSFFKELTPADLERLTMACAPLAALWLASGYENSPLAIFKNFKPSWSEIDLLEKSFKNFQNAEEKRLHLISLHEEQFWELNDQDPANAAIEPWLSKSAPEINNLSPENRRRLARWLPLIEKDAAEITKKIDGIIEDLALCPIENFSNLFSINLAEAKNNLPASIYKNLDIRLNKPFWAHHFNPQQLWASFKTNRFIKFCGLQSKNADTLNDLFKAAKLEKKIKPVYQRLADLCAELGHQPPPSGDRRALMPFTYELKELIVLMTALVEGLMALPQAARLRQPLLTADETVWEKAVNQYQEAYWRYQIRGESLEALNNLSAWAEPCWLDQLASAIQQNLNIHSPLKVVEEALPRLSAYQEFRLRANDLKENEKNALALLRASETALSNLKPEQLETAVSLSFRHAALTAWREQLESDKPRLLQNQEEIEGQIKALIGKIDQLKTLNKACLKQSTDRSQLAPLRHWENITRLRGQRARRLREFINEGLPLGLLQLRPVWLMNPDTASRLLPLKPGLFDFVVYDESTQLPVEYAVPTLYRAKSAVVSGDEKQMPPSSFFAARLNIQTDEKTVSEADDESEAEDTPGETLAAIKQKPAAQEIKDAADLLELAKRTLPRAFLKVHYRSRYGQLIAFSNAAFYNGRLNISSRRSKTEVMRHKPLEFIDVNGIYNEQTNLLEAKTAINILSKIWKQPAPKRPSVGVVTLNLKQAELIEELLRKETDGGDNPALSVALAEERNRCEQGEDMSFFIKNVENVQGDERDVIIFSSTFGRDATGRFVRNFGALGQKGGERRLNVAVTRAKEKVILINSMPVADISDMLHTSRRPLVPRDYLQIYWAYVQALSNSDFDYADFLLKRIKQTESVRVPEAPPKEKGGLVATVAGFLASHGFSPEPGGRAEALRVDLLLADPATGRYLVGLECGAPSHPLLQKARAREIWRPQVLARAIPAVIRLSAQAWLADRRAEEANLLSAVNQAFEAARDDSEFVS